MNSNETMENLFVYLHNNFPLQIERAIEQLGFSHLASPISTKNLTKENCSIEISQLVSKIMHSLPIETVAEDPYLNILATTIRSQSRRSSKSPTTPNEMMQANFDREILKYHRSKLVIRRINHLKTEASRKAGLKLQQINRKAQRTKPSPNSKHSQAKTPQRISKSENRLRTIPFTTQRKKAIHVKKDIYEHEDSFENKRLQSVDKSPNSIQNITENKDKFSVKQLDTPTIEIDSQYKTDDKNIDSDTYFKLEAIEIKHKEKELKHEKNLKKISAFAREHSDRVSHNLEKNRAMSQLSLACNLHKAIKKSHVCELKLNIKQNLSKKNSEQTNMNFTKSFDRHFSNLQILNTEEIKRKKGIETRLKRVDKACESVQRSKSNFQAHKQKENMIRVKGHALCYSKCASEQKLFKQKVLQKHMKISKVAETLIKQKENLSTHKRIHNLEIQRLRSA